MKIFDKKKINDCTFSSWYLITCWEWPHLKMNNGLVGQKFLQWFKCSKQLSGMIEKYRGIRNYTDLEPKSKSIKNGREQTLFGFWAGFFGLLVLICPSGVILRGETKTARQDRVWIHWRKESFDWIFFVKWSIDMIRKIVWKYRLLE